MGKVTRINRPIRDTLGEGALWCARDGAFYWVDILAPALNRLVLDTGEIRRWNMPEPLHAWAVAGEDDVDQMGPVIHLYVVVSDFGRAH